MVGHYQKQADCVNLQDLLWLYWCEYVESRTSSCIPSQNVVPATVSVSVLVSVSALVRLRLVQNLESCCIFCGHSMECRSRNSCSCNRKWRSLVWRNKLKGKDPFSHTRNSCLSIHNPAIIDSYIWMHVRPERQEKNRSRTYPKSRMNNFSTKIIAYHGAFYICVIPYLILEFISCNSVIGSHIKIYFGVLMFASRAINVFIYTHMYIHLSKLFSVI